MDMPPLDQERAERLLAHIMTADTRWFKISLALLNFGRRGVPDHRDSYNPIKWAAAEIGLWMDTRQIKATNREFDRRKRGQARRG